ncbi:hypothetical protein Acid345_2003 [Candidatus Koribacter versatilis Ellin345]|uniref:Type 4 fimbrial biogenesis protein PilX N-terminal domain-containing protein n=1 Tax=Koribacter versatilis (strain Ellin345) TaxID=204669 RepID=Q1IQ46_KORVE|nr:PilX N-terminal domain-containing pilus assembly protein [Candidatus Koribacter versatilis]ABF41004.1 hypothetical protein Acid345_2003 [Candidatus Koribacter versatilis Ellin345]
MKNFHPIKTKRAEQGFALILTLLLLLLVTGLAVSVMYLAMSQRQVAGSDSETTLAYYGGEAGMEKMMADLADLYQSKQTPSLSDLSALTSKQPNIQGITYTDPNVANAYLVTAPNNGSGYPVSYSSTVASGPNAGLIAQIIPISLSLTASRPEGTQARMFRKVEVALIPVFQFGVFSDADLSYFPGPVFQFGGRVHTNGNLWLASGNNLTFFDKITAYGNVIRAKLANTFDATAGAYGGSVNLPTQPGGCGTPAAPGGSFCRAMAFTEGSVKYGNYCPSGLNSAPNCDSTSSYNAAWATTASWSGTTGPISGGNVLYQGMILNGQTGATKLSLPFVGNGVSPIEIIRRAQAGDSDSVSQSRLYNEASIRILLDDNPFNLSAAGPADPNNIPLASVLSGGKISTSGWGGSPAYPYWATGTNANNFLTTGRDPNYMVPDLRVINDTQPATPGGNAVDPYKYLAGAVPDAGDGGSGGKTVYSSVAGSPFATGTYLAAKATAGETEWPLLSGWIRVEATSTAGSGYFPVTKEWLSFGWTRQYNTFPDSETPTPNTIEPNAILHLQQIISGTRGTISPTYSAVDIKGFQVVPINMYDPREGELRDVTTGKAAGSCALNGLMNLVELNVGNLKRWLGGTIGTTGTSVDKTTFNGYIVYFSDRRGGSFDGGYDYLDTTNSTNSITVTSSPTPSANVSTGIGDGVLSAEEDVYQGTYPVEIGGAGAPTGTLVTPPKFIGAAFGLGQTTTGNPGVSQRINCATLGAWNVVLAPRHALRLVNGTLNNLPMPGFTVASEQPVYVVGNYNASNGSGLPNTGVDSAASVIADTVTLLSRSFNDSGSLLTPFAPDTASTTYYRLAIASGKTLSFKQPSGWGNDYGTDGGVHNFLRYIENWGSASLYYEGSMVSLYYSRYGTGAFKCCTTVYSPPTRKYSFDPNFLTPSLLPPGTPEFKDVVDLGFQQNLNP